MLFIHYGYKTRKNVFMALVADILIFARILFREWRILENFRGNFFVVCKIQGIPNLGHSSQNEILSICRFLASYLTFLPCQSATPSMFVKTRE